MHSYLVLPTYVYWSGWMDTAPSLKRTVPPTKSCPDKNVVRFVLSTHSASKEVSCMCFYFSFKSIFIVLRYQ